MTTRAIKKVFYAAEVSEGQGAVVRRSIGTRHLRNFSPFLMLDHFNVNPPAGFPDHPHRGQETITYVLSGAVQHEDFSGSAGTIKKGDLQFMTAGRGIVHAEIPPPELVDGESNTGLQLWVDLPEHLKNCEPRYRDLLAAEIPEIHPTPLVDIKIISGESHGVESVKELAYTPVWVFDVTIRPGGSVTQPLPEGWNAFAYTLEGNAVFGGTKVKQYHNVVFESAGDSVDISVEQSETEPARFVIIAGTPLDQPVHQMGPFVATSQAAIYEAISDYQQNKNGFERAKSWRSNIAKEMLGY